MSAYKNLIHSISWHGRSSQEQFHPQFLTIAETDSLHEALSGDSEGFGASLNFTFGTTSAIGKIQVSGATSARDLEHSLHYVTLIIPSSPCNA